MKKFFQEFRAFISRGNVIDLAVGVIIGSAFTAIVTALTENILKPLINWVLAAIIGSDSLSGVFTFLKTAYLEDGITVDLANSIYIDWGSFINAIINFIIIALVVFLIVKFLNRAMQLADIDANMIKNVQAKLDKDEPLTNAEQKWLNLYTKRYPDLAPKKSAPIVPAEPEPVVLSTTEQLLTDILAQLKQNK